MKESSISRSDPRDARSAPGMVERVARAMWQAEWDRAKAHAEIANARAGREVFVHTVPRWENCNLIFLGYARSALEAMREPTEAMWEASGATYDESDGFHRNDVSTAWTAMIQAALAEPQ